MSQHDAQLSDPNHVAAIDMLPPALLRAVFLSLPADARARAACVRRGWRAFLADPSLWLRLDLSTGSGVTCRLNNAAVCAAAARAQGRLEALNIDRSSYDVYVLDVAVAVYDVVEANAASLRELSGMYFDVENSPKEPDGLAELQELVASAPALEVLEASLVTCSDCLLACRLLRNEPPFGPLRMHGLRMHSMTVVRGASDADFRAMVAALSSHHSLTELCLFIDYNEFEGTPPLSTDELGLLVDAALAACLKTLQLNDSGLTPAAAPVLARLLSSPALTYLHIMNHEVYGTLLDAPGYALLGDALRVNRTLCHLTLIGVEWLDVAAEVPALFGALTGHASLRCLDFFEHYLGDLAGADLTAATAVFGHALGSLIEANAPALKEFKISFHPSVTGATVFGPLVDALPHNTHLQELELRSVNLGADFAEQRLLPAIRANTSLRKLRDDPVRHGIVALTEAVQLVDLREAARVAAEAAAAAEDA